MGLVDAGVFSGIGAKSFDVGIRASSVEVFRSGVGSGEMGSTTRRLVAVFLVTDLVEGFLVDALVDDFFVVDLGVDFLEVDGFETVVFEFLA